jgi:hypothetical protein
MQIVQENDVRVVRIAGHLTSAQVPELMAACREAPSRVRVDLSDLLLADPIATDALRRVNRAGKVMRGGSARIRVTAVPQRGLAPSS